MNAPPDHPEPAVPAETQLEVIQGSLRSFVLGLFALIPFIGLPFAIAAIVQSYRVKKAGLAWNPASAYAKAGAWFGPLGILNTALAVMGAMVLIAAIQQGAFDCSSGGG